MSTSFALRSPVKSLIIFLILAIGTEALSAGLEDSSTYKKHPELRPLIEEYWETFYRHKIAPSDSGAQIAAQVVLEEIEERLLSSGLDQNEMTSMRQDANSLFESHKVQAQRDADNSAIIELLEVVDILPQDELESRAREFINFSPGYSKIDFIVSKKLSDVSPKNALLFRLDISLLLLTSLLSTGTDLTKEPGAKAWRGPVALAETLGGEAEDRLERLFQKLRLENFTSLFLDVLKSKNLEERRVVFKNLVKKMGALPGAFLILTGMALLSPDGPWRAVFTSGLFAFSLAYLGLEHRANVAKLGSTKVMKILARCQREMSVPKLVGTSP